MVRPRAGNRTSRYRGLAALAARAAGGAGEELEELGDDATQNRQDIDSVLPDRQIVWTEAARWVANDAHYSSTMMPTAPPGWPSAVPTYGTAPRAEGAPLYGEWWAYSARMTAAQQTAIWAASVTQYRITLTTYRWYSRTSGGGEGRAASRVLTRAEFLGAGTASTSRGANSNLRNFIRPLDPVPSTADATLNSADVCFQLDSMRDLFFWSVRERSQSSVDGRSRAWFPTYASSIVVETSDGAGVPGVETPFLSQAQVDARVEAVRPNPFTTAEETKLAGIETGATADQTGAEMVTALSGLTGNARLPASAVRDIPIGGAGLNQAGVDARIVAGTLPEARAGNTDRWALAKLTGWPSGMSVSGQTLTLQRQGTTALTATLPAGGGGGGLTQAQVDARVVAGTLAAARSANTDRWAKAKLPTDTVYTGTQRFTPALLTKLNGVEASATADQTGAEMVTALSGLTGNNRLPATAVRDLPAGGAMGVGTAFPASAMTGDWFLLTRDVTVVTNPGVPAGATLTAGTNSRLATWIGWNEQTGTTFDMGAISPAVPTATVQNITGPVVRAIVYNTSTGTIHVLFHAGISTASAGRFGVVRIGTTDYVISAARANHGGGDSPAVSNPFVSGTAYSVQITFDAGATFITSHLPSQRRTLWPAFSVPPTTMTFSAGLYEYDGSAWVSRAGLTQAQVDARVVTGVLATARTGNTDRWAKTKLPTDTVYTNTQRFTSALLTKLNGVEASATADQTGAEMVTALSGLTGNARLPATAVRDLPSGGGGSASLSITEVGTDSHAAGAATLPGYLVAHATTLAIPTGGLLFIEWRVANGESGSTAIIPAVSLRALGAAVDEEDISSNYGKYYAYRYGTSADFFIGRSATNTLVWGGGEIFSDLGEAFSVKLSSITV